MTIGGRSGDMHELDQVALRAAVKESGDVSIRFIKAVKPEDGDVFKAKEITRLASMAAIDAYNTEAGLWAENEMLRQVLFNVAAYVDELFGFMTLNRSEFSDTAMQKMTDFRKWADGLKGVASDLEGNREDRMKAIALYQESGS